jgi:hypothetical protein
MIHEDNCSGTGKHAHPINRARPALTLPFPLIRHHSSLALVYLVCLVCLVRATKETKQPHKPKNWPSPASHPLYTPISSRFTFHVLRFTSPERQMISLGENGILYREHVRHNRRAILQAAQTGLFCLSGSSGLSGLTKQTRQTK